MQQAQSLVQGNIVKNLLHFTWPLLLANLLQSLYGSVDMAIVGWFSGTEGIAAVSNGSQLTFLANSLVVGLTMGGTILLGQYYGAGKKAEAGQTVGTILSMFTVVAAFFTAAFLLLAPWLLRLLKTPSEAMPQAIAYVRICALGMLFIFAYNALSAIFRAVGNSRAPLLFVGVACATNIVLDLIFVGPMQLGAAGAATATVISQGVSVALALVCLLKGKLPFAVTRSHFKIHGRTAGTILRLGLPISLQEFCVCVSFLVIAAIVNEMGLLASAAAGIAAKFESFAMLPASAFAGAVSAITAQNIGAGHPERASKNFWYAAAFSFLCSLPFFAWAQIDAASVMGLFGADSAVAISGAEYLRSFSIDFMLVAFVFPFGGFFSGCGKTTFTMLNGVLSSIALRLPFAYFAVTSFGLGLFGVGLAAPFASFLSIVAYVIYFFSGKWKKATLL